jgi:hypothetical protein
VEEALPFSDVKAARKFHAAWDLEETATAPPQFRSARTADPLSQPEHDSAARSRSISFDISANFPTHQLARGHHVLYYT